MGGADLVTQSVYRCSETAEYEWTVRPIPIPQDLRIPGFTYEGHETIREGEREFAVSMRPSYIFDSCNSRSKTTPSRFSTGWRKPNVSREREQLCGYDIQYAAWSDCVNLPHRPFNDERRTCYLPMSFVATQVKCSKDCGFYERRSVSSLKKLAMTKQFYKSS